MKAWLIIGTLLAVGAGAGSYGYELWRKEQQALAQDVQLRGRLEFLIADMYEPPDPSPLARTRFRELGCKEEGTLAPTSPKARRAEIERLLAQHPQLPGRLRADDSAAAQYVLAMLMQKNLLGDQTAVVGLDPEALLRRAAAKAHGHASYYFARLEADSEPAASEAFGSAKSFGELNHRLERAADAGSGGAAYLLGFRSDPEIFRYYAQVAPAQRSRWQELPRVKELLAAAAEGRVSQTSRSPREWWCRAAELGHAGGQMNCFRYGKRRQAEALRWLMLAADGGQESASYALAQLYAEGGRGLAKDEKKAIQLYCRSVLQGHPEADRALDKLQRARAWEAKRRLAEEKRLSKLSPKARQAELERRKKARLADERAKLEREARREAARSRPKSPPPAPLPAPLPIKDADSKPANSAPDEEEVETLVH